MKKYLMRYRIPGIKNAEVKEVAGFSGADAAKRFLETHPGAVVEGVSVGDCESQISRRTEAR